MDLILCYSPGVAEPVKQIANDPERIWDLTIKNNTVAVITDGSAILGLGNLGPEAALPVMEGKCMLFKKFGGINAVSYTHLRAHETVLDLVCRLLLEKKKNKLTREHIYTRQYI